MAQDPSPPKQQGGAMTFRHLVVVGLTVAFGAAVPFSSRLNAADERNGGRGANGLAQVVRDATAAFRDVRVAEAAGYGSLGSCVTGPERGAMGVHFANGALLEDDVVEPRRPELLVYEPRGGRMYLVGVEFIVIADAWNASHPDGEAPTVMGQHMQFVGAPNRYRLPAFYELHVWAWRDNRFGTFVDWNPAVSCDEFSPDHAHH
jgi:hypothetical protein